MTLAILPTRQAGAAENMATDFLLLKRYPILGHARFRHYGWHRAAFTFGYSQKIAYVRTQLPAGEAPELCRRPTGGGVVDHRADWTYALVIPRGHPLCDLPAPKSYRAIHACIVDVLTELGQPVVLKEHCEPSENAASCPAGPTVCFAQPELYDVLHITSGMKVAGAAQKRTKDGLLFQGSIARDTLTATLDWDAFHAAFTAALAKLMELEAQETGWPDFAEDELAGLTDAYAAPEWNELR